MINLRLWEISLTNIWCIFLKKWKCIEVWWSKLKPTSGTFWISMIHTTQFSSVQSLSHVWLFVTPWTVASQASLSITNSQSLLKLMSIKSVISSNSLILCHPLLLLPSIFPASNSFPVSQFFTSGGQSIGVSASASVLPINIQDGSPLGWTGWISLQSRGPIPKS